MFSRRLATCREGGKEEMRQGARYLAPLVHARRRRLPGPRPGVRGGVVARPLRPSPAGISPTRDLVPASSPRYLRRRRRLPVPRAGVVAFSHLPLARWILGEMQGIDRTNSQNF